MKDIKYFILTKNENEIMNLLWSVNKPLSRSEIIKLSPDKTWKDSSIHILLNQLLGKGAIIVDGFIKTGKNYGRIFSPALSQEDYKIMQLKGPEPKSSAITSLVLTLLESEEFDDDTINKLEDILYKKRRKE